MLSKSFLAQATAMNIATTAVSGTHIVFVDSMITVVDLARELVKSRKDPREIQTEPVTNEDNYYKLRVLFDDLDVELENPKIQEQLRAIACVDTFEQFSTQSRDCFVEKQIKLPL